MSDPSSLIRCNVSYLQSKLPSGRYILAFGPSPKYVSSEDQPMKTTDISSEKSTNPQFSKGNLSFSLSKQNIIKAKSPKEGPKLTEADISTLSLSISVTVVEVKVDTPKSIPHFEEAPIIGQGALSVPFKRILVNDAKNSPSVPAIAIDINKVIMSKTDALSPGEGNLGEVRVRIVCVDPNFKPPSDKSETDSKSPPAEETTTKSSNESKEPKESKEGIEKKEKAESDPTKKQDNDPSTSLHSNPSTSTDKTTAESTALSAGTVKTDSSGKKVHFDDEIADKDHLDHRDSNHEEKEEEEAKKGEGDDDGMAPDSTKTKQGTKPSLKLPRRSKEPKKIPSHLPPLPPSSIRLGTVPSRTPLPHVCVCVDAVRGIVRDDDGMAPDSTKTKQGTKPSLKLPRRSKEPKKIPSHLPPLPPSSIRLGTVPSRTPLPHVCVCVDAVRGIVRKPQSEDGMQARTDYTTLQELAFEQHLEDICMSDDPKVKEQFAAELKKKEHTIHTQQTRCKNEQQLLQRLACGFDPQSVSICIERGQFCRCQTTSSPPSSYTGQDPNVSPLNELYDPDTSDHRVIPCVCSGKLQLSEEQDLLHSHSLEVRGLGPKRYSKQVKGKGYGSGIMSTTHRCPPLYLPFHPASIRPDLCGDTIDQSSAAAFLRIHVYLHSSLPKHLPEPSAFLPSSGSSSSTTATNSNQSQLPVRMLLCSICLPSLSSLLQSPLERSLCISIPNIHAHSSPISLLLRLCLHPAAPIAPPQMKSMDPLLNPSSASYGIPQCVYMVHVLRVREVGIQEQWKRAKKEWEKLQQEAISSANHAIAEESEEDSQIPSQSSQTSASGGGTSGGGTSGGGTSGGGNTQNKKEPEPFPLPPPPRSLSEVQQFPICGGLMTTDIDTFAIVSGLSEHRAQRLSPILPIHVSLDQCSTITHDIEQDLRDIRNKRDTFEDRMSLEVPGALSTRMKDALSGSPSSSSSSGGSSSSKKKRKAADGSSMIDGDDENNEDDIKSGLSEDLSFISLVGTTHILAPLSSLAPHAPSLVSSVSLESHQMSVPSQNKKKKDAFERSLLEKARIRQGMMPGKWSDKATTLLFSAITSPTPLVDQSGTAQRIYLELRGRANESFNLFIKSPQNQSSSSSSSSSNSGHNDHGSYTSDHYVSSLTTGMYEHVPDVLLGCAHIHIQRDVVPLLRRVGGAGDAECVVHGVTCEGGTLGGMLEMDVRVRVVIPAAPPTLCSQDPFFLSGRVSQVMGWMHPPIRASPSSKSPNSSLTIPDNMMDDRRRVASLPPHTFYEGKKKEIAARKRKTQSALMQIHPNQARRMHQQQTGRTRLGTVLEEDEQDDVIRDGHMMLEDDLGQLQSTLDNVSGRSSRNNVSKQHGMHMESEYLSLDGGPDVGDHYARKPTAPSASALIESLQFLKDTAHDESVAIIRMAFSSSPATLLSSFTSTQIAQSLCVLSEAQGKVAHALSEQRDYGERMEAEFEELSAEFRTLKSRHHTVKRTAVTQQKVIHTLEDRMAALKKSIINLRSEKDGLVAQLELALKEASRAGGLVEGAKKDRLGREKELEEAHEEMKRAYQAEIDALKTEMRVFTMARETDGASGHTGGAGHASFSSLLSSSKVDELPSFERERKPYSPHARQRDVHGRASSQAFHSPLPPIHHQSGASGSTAFGNRGRAFIEQKHDIDGDGNTEYIPLLPSVQIDTLFIDCNDCNLSEELLRPEHIPSLLESMKGANVTIYSRKLTPETADTVTTFSGKLLEHTGSGLFLQLDDGSIFMVPEYDAIKSMSSDESTTIHSSPIPQLKVKLRNNMELRDLDVSYIANGFKWKASHRVVIPSAAHPFLPPDFPVPHCPCPLPIPFENFTTSFNTIATITLPTTTPMDIEDLFLVVGEEIKKFNESGSFRMKSNAMYALDVSASAGMSAEFEEITGSHVSSGSDYFVYHIPSSRLDLSDSHSTSTSRNIRVPLSSPSTLSVVRELSWTLNDILFDVSDSSSYQDIEENIADHVDRPLQIIKITNNSSIPIPPGSVVIGEKDSVTGDHTPIGEADLGRITVGGTTTLAPGRKSGNIQCGVARLSHETNRVKKFIGEDMTWDDSSMRLICWEVIPKDIVCNNSYNVQLFETIEKYAPKRTVIGKYQHYSNRATIKENALKRDGAVYKTGDGVEIVNGQRNIQFNFDIPPLSYEEYTEIDDLMCTEQSSLEVYKRLLIDTEVSIHLEYDY
ncbi:hypothetical protein ADUPG1_012215 [Aduncisulcus paluster]|uniref:Uncharacterized protein n=1 Tax=Aduncisulcus paluster TaxID=2918883 RepID=A0ABQ5JZE5_9EUKA|nr:hypothetical protein ADUPG1_012215 [Aduncisulcus paluster]